MKNKKGFTLVELLAVIVILAIIISIAVPGTLGISNRIKEKLFCSKIDFIENAAKLYGEDKRDSLTTNVSVNGGSYKGKTIQVSELVNKNYLKKDQDTSPYILDPRYNKDSKIGLDSLSLTIYIKNNRVYVHFNSTDVSTCKK